MDRQDQATPPMQSYSTVDWSLQLNYIIHWRQLLFKLI